MSSFIKNLVKNINDENTTIASEGKSSAEFTGYIDTGSYILNALISGTIYGGIPNNKVIALAGESSVGKSFVALGIIQKFLADNQEAIAIDYLSEPAITNEMMIERGIDTDRVIIAEPVTVQQFRHHAIKTLESYISSEEKPPLLMVLDSLGALSTTKEVEDTAEGKETQDMTRAKVIKAAFRVLTLKMARAKVPMIITNHTYEEMCLDGSVLIKTTNGFKEIKDIEVGDRVYALTGIQKVTHKFTPKELKPKNKKFLELEFDDGTKIKCTHDHKFLMNNEMWVKAEDIKIGDEFK